MGQPTPVWPFPPTATPTPTHIMLVGGSFDPPHRGHTELAHQAARQLSDSLPNHPRIHILFVPAAWSPLKHGTPRTPAHHRLAMITLAAATSGDHVWNDELLRFEASGGSTPSYTIDTLRRLRACAPAPLHLYLLVGSDQAAQFHRWHEHRAILELARPAVLLRDPCTTPDALRAAMRETGHWTPDEANQWANWCLPGLPRMDISSTAIRAAIAAGTQPTPIPGLHPDVAAYINAHHLYTLPST